MVVNVELSQKFENRWAVFNISIIWLSFISISEFIWTKPLGSYKCCRRLLHSHTGPNIIDFHSSLWSYVQSKNRIEKGKSIARLVFWHVCQSHYFLIHYFVWRLNFRLQWNQKYVWASGAMRIQFRKAKNHLKTPTPNRWTYIEIQSYS